VSGKLELSTQAPWSLQPPEAVHGAGPSQKPSNRVVDWLLLVVVVVTVDTVLVVVLVAVPLNFRYTSREAG